MWLFFCKFHSYERSELQVHKRYENLKIKEMYDENWERRCRETGKEKKIDNSISGVRAMIEISDKEWGEYEMSL